MSPLWVFKLMGRRWLERYWNEPPALPTRPWRSLQQEGISSHATIDELIGPAPTVEP